MAAAGHMSKIESPGGVRPSGRESSTHLMFLTIGFFET